MGHNKDIEAIPESKTTCQAQSEAKFDLLEVFGEVRKDFNRIDQDRSGVLDRYELSQWSVNGQTEKSRTAAKYVTDNFDCIKESTLRVAIAEKKLNVFGLNAREVKDSSGLTIKHIDALDTIVDKDKSQAAIKDAVELERKEDRLEGYNYLVGGALTASLGGAFCLSVFFCVFPGSELVLGGLTLSGVGVSKYIDERTAARRGREREAEFDQRRKVLKSTAGH